MHLISRIVLRHQSESLLKFSNSLLIGSKYSTQSKPEEWSPIYRLKNIHMLTSGARISKIIRLVSIPMPVYIALTEQAADNYITQVVSATICTVGLAGLATCYLRLISDFIGVISVSKQDKDQIRIGYLSSNNRINLLVKKQDIMPLRETTDKASMHATVRMSSNDKVLKMLHHPRFAELVDKKLFDEIFRPS